LSKLGSIDEFLNEVMKIENIDMSKCGIDEIKEIK